MLTTSRLHIRPFTPQDAPFILDLLNSPGWLQFIGDREVRTLVDAETYLTDRLIPSYEEHGFGFYACDLLSDGTTIGMNGIAQRPYLDVPDLGFGFLPPYFRQGFAYESSIALLDFATQQLSITKLGAFTSLNNVASIGLLEKLGFIQAGPFFIPDNPEELLLLKWGVGD